MLSHAETIIVLCLLETQMRETGMHAHRPPVTHPTSATLRTLEVQTQPPITVCTSVDKYW